MGTTTSALPGVQARDRITTGHKRVRRCWSRFLDGREFPPFDPAQKAKRSARTRSRRRWHLAADVSLSLMEFRPSCAALPGLRHVHHAHALRQGFTERTRSAPPQPYGADRQAGRILKTTLTPRRGTEGLTRNVASSTPRTLDGGDRYQPPRLPSPPQGRHDHLTRRHEARRLPVLACRPYANTRGPGTRSPWPRLGADRVNRLDTHARREGLMPHRAPMLVEWRRFPAIAAPTERR